MKFDKAALAITLGVSATMLAGCDQKQCVDAAGKVVAEANCKGAPTQDRPGYVGSHYSFVPFWMLWGMGRGSGYGYGAGARPVAPVGDAHSGAVSRGGFGGTAAGEGGAGE